MMIIKNGNIFCDDGEFRKLDIEVQNGVITAIGENISDSAAEVIYSEGDYIVPGFVDIHSHGAMGADFSDGTAEAVQTIAKYYLSNGITSFLGTTMSLPEKQLVEICGVYNPLINNETTNLAVFRGIHLEGPYFSQERRGAQNPAYLVNPDITMFSCMNEASGDAVRMIAVAPELDGAMDFIEAASKVCTVSLAHSTANCETAKNAFSRGADHVTHLFNGMNPMSHREPGIIGAASDCNAFVELIADGIHIHPTVVCAVFKLYGEDKVCLISDSIRACGLTDGQYDLGGQMITVKGKSATVSDNTLAGSVTCLADCMRNAVNFSVPLTKALKAATINPAISVGLDKEIGSLSIGKRADILILDRELALKKIIFNGKQID